MEKKVRLCLFSFILLIFSCDENEVVFEDSASLGIDFIQSSFIMNLNQSISSYPDSAFNFRNNQFNLSLSPKLYIGNIGYSESVNLSYALLKVNPNIIDNYSICDSSLLSIKDVVLTLTFDNQLYNYNQNINEDTINSNYSFIDDFLEETSQYAVPVYMNSYFLNDLPLLNFSDSLFEQKSDFYDVNFIDEVISSFKSQNYILSKSKNSNNKLDLNLSSQISNEDWCNNNVDSFYILVEYNSFLNDNNEYLSIISTDNFYVPSQPKLTFNFEKNVFSDTLITNLFDLNQVNNSTFTYVSDDSTTQVDSTFLQNPPNIYLVNSSNVLNSDNLVDNTNVVAVNNDNNSDNFGTFVGYKFSDDESYIIPSTNGDKDLFDVDITLNENFEFDSLRFYFSDILFAFQKINNTYDYGEPFDDFGIDNCINHLETGDILLDEFNSENNCLCNSEYGLWNGFNCSDGSYTGNVWDNDSLLCYVDMNRDLVYDLCGNESTTYNDSGTENNGILDWNDNGDGIWESGEGEKWLDLGLDWIQGTLEFGAADDFETGCRTSVYPNGIGYVADSNEDYISLVNYALDYSLIESENFYNFQYELSNGSIVTICGQEFWDNPLIEGVPSCSYCSSNDPNGDNKNTDPAGDDWIANISGNGDDAWDEGESFEGNGQWDWIDFNEDGILDDGEFEPFLDYGINQLPDNLEGSDYELDNNPGSENNLMYDFGEIFFDTGLDGKFSYQEENYNMFGKQGNGIIDFDSNNNAEFNDFGLDNCPNNYESFDGSCNGQENNLNFDLHLDDFNIDPNQDNYSSSNFTGTENNNTWDFLDSNGDNIFNLDEDLISIYTDEETCTENNYFWSNGICFNDSDFNGEYNFQELSESFYENDEAMPALVNIGQNAYYYNLSNSGEIDYQIPVPNSVFGQDIFLWISKINQISDNQYRLTISINSSVNIDAFQFKLNIGPYYNETTEIIDQFIDLIAYDFDDDNSNNLPDSGEINPDLKFIHDVSLYDLYETGEECVDDPISYENPLSCDNDLIISYTYGINRGISFGDLNDFIIENNQSVFIAEQQTNLILNFDTESVNHFIPPEGANLIFSGELGNSISIPDYISPKTIYQNTDEILIPIGSLLNQILEQGQILENEILFTISLDKYSNVLTKIVLSDIILPQIDMMYSK